MRGVLLFAFNNGVVDYYEMACKTARRINHFLDLPVTVITDKNTYFKNYNYSFDKVIIVDSDNSNTKGRNIWINKNRYQAFELTPYDETILIDTDFLVNSNKLLDAFLVCDDYAIHKKTQFVFHEVMDEYMSATSFETLWATVFAFKKTLKTKQFFDCVKMVQHNYNHYVHLYNMMTSSFRNDYAFTIAHRVINGNIEVQNNLLPWKLLHAGSDVKIHKLSDNEFNTDYIMFFTNIKNKTEYIKIKETDFHCMNKTNYMEIV
jgi:hypothetical protein